jgi:prepilin-type N-terminal cleavage/methylation domain-containing protein
MKQAQKGFTLVEIAIVLVIIGLLLGGILKGQEMITQAKIKNVMSDFSGVSAAYHGYQDRYRAIPGDDPGANARWTLGIAAPATGAFGDGVVSGLYGSATANDESRLFWLHLRSAGFIANTAANQQNQPLNALAGTLGVQTGNGAGGTVLAAAGAGAFSSLIQCSANLPDKMAIAVDAQMDDGVRTTGTVRAQLNTGPNPAIVADATVAAVGGANSYQENGTNVYTLCRGM